MHSTRLSKFCDKVLEIGWLLAVIVTPLFFNVYSSRVFEPDKLTTLRTIAVVMAVVWMVKFIEERAHGRRDVGFSWQTPLVYPTLFTLAVYLLSTALSVNPWTSLFGSYQRLQGTYTTFSYVVIFLVILQGLRSRVQLDRLLTVVILNSLPIALYGLVQRNRLDPLPWGGNVTRRVASNMGNAIFVAAYMIMAAPPTLSRVVDAFRSILTDEETGPADMLRAAVYIFIFFVQLIAIWYTQSRGPLMGLMAGLGIWVVLGFLALRHVLSRRLWRGIWLGALGTVLVVVVVFFLINPGGPLHEWAVDTPLNRLGRVLEYRSGTGMVRNLIWQGSLDLILPHEPIWYPPTAAHPEGHSDPFNSLRPLVGYGPESMYTAYNSFYPPLLGHYESRTASPDRSHNETMDAWVTKGFLGFVAYLWLFGSVFTFGLRWLGFLPDDWRRKLFFGLLAGGAIVATVVVSLTVGLHFFGLAIPIGIVGGLFLYLIIWGFSEWESTEDVKLHPRFVLLMGLLSAMVAHFVEINFGIAIAATRTTFWCYAGLLVVTGMNLIQDHEEEEANWAAGRNRSGLPRWLRPTLVTSIIGGFIIGTLSFDFVTNAERLTQPAEIVWRALTVLPAQGSRSSYGALMIFAFTWVMSAVLFIAQMAKRGVFQERHDDWAVATSLYALVSLAVGFGFALILAGRHVAVVKAQPQTVEGVLELAGRVAGVLTLYYGLILFTMVAGGLLLLLGTRGDLKPNGQLGLIALPVLFLLAGAVAIVTNLHPIRADIIYKQADPWERQGQWPVAIQHYQRAIDLAPREDFYYLYLGRAYLEYAKTLEDPAVQRTILGRTEETLIEAREVNPLNTDHSANLARMYRTWAQLARDAETRQEMTQRSSENYAVATRLSPQNAILWNEWGLLYLASGQFEEAQVKIAHSLEIDPEFDETWTIQADLYANQNMITEALEAYTRALELNPKQTDVWLRVGDLRRQQQDFEEAAEAYEQALELRPNNVQVWRVLGSVYAQIGQPEKGIEALNRALELAPESEDAWDTHRMLAILYSQVGEPDQAIDHAESALQGAPDQQQADLEELLAQLESATDEGRE
jgi:tetratricopeptide (TPR) repeat protein/MFS family permease